MMSTQNSTVDLPGSKNRRIFLSFSALSLLVPRTFLIQNVAFTPLGKKASVHREFEMAMKQPILAPFLKMCQMIRINRH